MKKEEKLNNLIPICNSCNLSMDIKNMNIFVNFDFNTIFIWQ